jgi:hypothetical protein
VLLGFGFNTQYCTPVTPGQRDKEPMIVLTVAAGLTVISRVSVLLQLLASVPCKDIAGVRRWTDGDMEGPVPMVDPDAAPRVSARATGNERYGVTGADRVIDSGDGNRGQGDNGYCNRRGVDAIGTARPGHQIGGAGNR